VTVVDLSEGLSLDKILLADKTVDSAMAPLASRYHLNPRFPPSSWRDFSLAELFREAGREVAEAELVHLLEASRPTARMN
jgi:hypothetical protein